MDGVKLGFMEMEKLDTGVHVPLSVLASTRPSDLFLWNVGRIDGGNTTIIFFFFITYI